MTQTNRDKLNTLEGQLNQLTDELNALKKQRAEARVNGGIFSNADRITAIAVEIEEINEAIPLAQRLVDADDARAQASADAGRIEMQIDRYETLVGTYLDAVAKIETLTVELHGALGTVHAAMPELRDAAYQLSGQRDEPILNGNNVDARLLARMAEVLGDDMSALGGFRVARRDSEKWLAAWAEEESRSLKNVFGKPVLRARERAQNLRASAAE